MRVLSVLALVAVAAAARGDELERPPPTVWATIGGAATALVPLAVGGAMFASSDADTVHRAAIYAMMAGLTVAPALSHLLVREYKRAAIFAALPLAALIAETILFQVEPDVTTYGSPAGRTVYGVALAAAVIGATVGLGDTFGATDRWRARHPVVTPTVGSGIVGLAVGGAW